MFQVAICDDDVFAVNELKKSLANYSFEKKVFFNIVSYTSAVEFSKDDNFYDLIFLDIEMPGKNGIELGTKIKKLNRQTQIIYVTSYTNYMNQAFKVRSFGYVVKPFQENDIYNEIDAYVSMFSSNKHKSYSFIDKKTTVNISFEDIYYFEYLSSRCIKLISKVGNYEVRNKTLQGIKEELNYESFVSTHKSFIVNMLHINRFDCNSVIMTNDFVIPIALKKISYVKNTYNKFINDYL